MRLSALVIGAGGTATNDGGAGLLAAVNAGGHLPELGWSQLNSGVLVVEPEAQLGAFPIAIAAERIVGLHVLKRCHLAVGRVEGRVARVMDCGNHDAGVAHIVFRQHLRSGIKAHFAT